MALRIILLAAAVASNPGAPAPPHHHGHDYVAKLLSVAGDDAPPRKPALYYPHLAGDDQGSVCGWRWRKRSAEAAGGPREECYVPRRAGREYVPGV